MFIVKDYSMAVLLCFITMICWGSWGNTQKLASKNWRFELFYWDYVLGMLIVSLVIALSLGSIGNEGRPFLTDILQTDFKNIGFAILGGIIFNAGNILLSAAISIAGMAVAFPVGVGIALVLGVIINYFAIQSGNPYFLFLGVALVTIAILINAWAYKNKNQIVNSDKSSSKKGLILSVIAGVLMSFFYRFIALSMDLENFENPMVGKMTPYSAFFVFAIGVFLSNIFFNTIIIKKPFVGKPTSYIEYFKGSFNNHITGVLGGIIWGLGNSFNLISAGKAGAAISYGLGQGATLVAALWGVFIWKEFKGSPRKVVIGIMLMFLFFIVGLSLIIFAGKN
jgi:glucose uptake protein